MKKKQLKISIKHGVWICVDPHGIQGAGVTPNEAWIKYQLKTLDKAMKRGYNSASYN